MGLLLTVDGQPVDVDVDRLNGLEAKAFREVHGVPVGRVWRDGADLDHICTVAYLLARREHPDLTLDEVLAAITFADLTAADQTGDDVGEGEGDHPEA